MSQRPTGGGTPLPLSLGSASPRQEKEPSPTRGEGANNATGNSPPLVGCDSSSRASISSKRQRPRSMVRRTWHAPIGRQGARLGPSALRRAGFHHHRRSYR